MGRLLLLLAAFLGWAIVTRKPKVKGLYGNDPDAFPFPTSDSHSGVTLDAAADVTEWCRTFGCSEEQLRAAVKAVGNSPDAVRRHVSRRR